MKRTLIALTAWMAACSAPTHQVTPSPQEMSPVQRAIMTYNNPSSSSAELYGDFQTLSYFASQGDEEARLFLEKESLIKDPALDEQNSLNRRLKKRCVEKDADACYYLYSVYRDGQFGLSDSPRALSYAERADELGSIDATRSLGYDYLIGHGVQKDSVKAINYLKKASDAGDETAQGTLKAIEEFQAKYGPGIENNLIIPELDPEENRPDSPFVFPSKEPFSKP